MPMGFEYVLDHIAERRHNRFAVVIFLPPPLEEVVAPLREKYDPIYNLISPHVSLVFPFDSNRSLDELVLAVRSTVEGERQFKIELSSIGDFYPSDPVIFWDVRDNPRLTDLHFRLHVSLGLALPHQKYRPHVTVGREISHHRVTFVKDRIVSYLRDDHFIATDVDLITPVSGNRWVSVRTFPLVEE